MRRSPMRCVYSPGVNMRRFVPYTALALYLSVLPATAADRYGGWLLEQPQSSVFTLSFKQSVPRATARSQLQKLASFVIKGINRRMSGHYSYPLMERSKIGKGSFPF